MRLQQHEAHCKHLSWYGISTTFMMYRSQIGCKHEPQLMVDAEPVEVEAGDLWCCSGGDETFIDVICVLFVCCCMIGDGLICVKIPVPSTIPAILAGRLPDELLWQFSFTIVICGGGCAVEHFMSMGTTAGEVRVNRKQHGLRLDKQKSKKLWLNIYI